MATVQEQVQQIYVGLLGRAADKEGFDYWVDRIESGEMTIEEVRSNAVNDQPEGQAIFDSGNSRTEIVTALYDNLFEREPDATGLDYWVNGEGADVDAEQLVLALINGAGEADEQVLANKVEAAQYYTDNAGASGPEFRDDARAAVEDVDDEASVAASIAATDALEQDGGGEEPVDPGVPGDIFALTASTDALEGTADNDTFEGYLSQNSFAGGVSNTLSSADRIDGGAGTDTLDVELVGEFVGASSVFNGIAVQPRTTSVENIEVEARDFAFGGGEFGGGEFGDESGGTITLDAKNMTDIDRIGSHYSDGNLVIDNLTTLTETGGIRLTDELTVVMQHTDNFNSDFDASDLSVYFDEDYLNTSSESGGSTLLVRLVNAITNVDNNNPIFGTDSFTFNVDGTEVVVDVSDIAANEALDFTTAYNLVADAIEAAAVDAGFDSISATLQPLSPTVFSIPVTVGGTEYEVGDSAGSYFPILISNEGAEELSQGSFTQSDVASDTDINASQVSAPASETEVPISINVELEKVGRDGEGGNLIIGGKDHQSNNDTDQDQNNGIEIFNVSVVGNDSKPSNLGQILSTAGALKTVNIVSADPTLDSFAALTVRGETEGKNDTTPFGGTLDTLNANGLLGNLQIGHSDASRAVDIETFTATGGGDVTYWTSIGEGGELGGLPSSGNLAYSATTGAGSDIINADVNGGAQYTVTTGTGNDTVIASVFGETDSGSTQSKIIINSAGGSNLVDLTSDTADVNEAEVTLGNGADTVFGGATFLTAVTGGGNDAIYTENTGTMAIATLAAGGSLLASDLNDENNYALGNKTELLFGRSVRVTLDLPEDAGTANTAGAFVTGLEATFDIAASNGNLTTERDLYEAVANAINEDDVLSKLAFADVDSNGQLIVSYLIDGVTDADDIVSFEVLGDWADLNATEQSSIVSQVQAQYQDSGITAADVENEYDEVLTQVDTASTSNTNGQEGADSTDGTFNSVNAGLGDDVVVLSSDATSVETLVFDQGGFGNDTIVHFDQPTDLLDFSAWLDNVESTSTSSVSETRVDGTVAAAGAIIENSVVVTDMSTIGDNDAGATSALEFDTMTNAGVLSELNAGDFSASISDGNLVGTDLKVMILVEDDANVDATDDNEGHYKAYEVVYNDADGEFTSATLVGSMDLGSDDAFDALASTNII